MRLAIIIEGHGEVESLPILVRRIASKINPALNITISKETVFRVAKGTIVNRDGLERAARTALVRLRGEGAILLLIDSDGDCPATIGPALQARLEQTCGHAGVAAVVAHQEYENWFIHSIESLSKRGDFKSNFSKPADPDSIRDAKGWIAKQRQSEKYSEILDQPKLSASIDIELARQSDSFDKLYIEIERLLSNQP